MMAAEESTMVTKTKSPATKPAAAAKRGAARKPAAEAPAVESDTSEPAKPNLLRAGLKALGNVRDDVVQHQSRVFEAILGIEPAQAWQGLVKRDNGAAKAAQEAFGLRKFEAVFDQRVVSALERMGMPAIDALKALAEQVAAMSDEVAALKDEVATLRDEAALRRTEPRPPKAAARKR
jgi:Poly(hydroxyalcanoate) granule associated protein (phasin)